MIAGKEKGKIADAVVELHDAVLTLRDYNEFPFVMEPVIRKLFPVDWSAFCILGAPEESVGILTDPALSDAWYETGKALAEAGNDPVMTEFLKLPVGGTLRYDFINDPCNDDARYYMDLYSRHTGVFHSLGVKTAKTFFSAFNFYRTDKKSRFLREEQEVLDYLSPVLVSISESMLFYNRYDLKRAAVDTILSDPETMWALLDDGLKVVDLHAGVAAFLSRHFPNTGPGSLPGPVLRWVQDEIAPSGRLETCTGPWRLTLALPEMKIVLRARVIVTEKNRTALLIRIIPHHRDVDFGILAALGLTGRETETLSYLPLGYSNRQIAAAMNIEEITAKKHLKNAAAKLHAYGKTETLYKAMKKKELLESMMLRP